LKIFETDIPEVKIVEPSVFEDERGFFMETWNAKRFADAGLDLNFVQDNHSKSAKGVLRGLHYQVTNPQGKLVRVVGGAVFDVAVDLRRSSQTFGKYVGVELSSENKRMLWVPPGFGHGFLTLEDETELVYKCTEFYDPTDEHCLIWNDPTIAITWPNKTSPPTLSRKDSAGLTLVDALVYA
jgi:dTDP-4-dehydrorhamnose 3,5-epimerase